MALHDVPLILYDFAQYISSEIKDYIYIYIFFAIV